MCSVVLAPAQIFRLIQMQSKSNPSAQKGIPHNPIIHKSSYVQYNINKSLTSTLVIYSFWAISVHFSPFGLLQSIWSIQSTLVNRFFSGPFWSTTPLSSLRYNLVYSVLLLHQVHFGLVGPVHSVLLVHFSLLALLC